MRIFFRVLFALILGLLYAAAAASTAAAPPSAIKYNLGAVSAQSETPLSNNIDLDLHLASSTDGSTGGFENKFLRAIPRATLVFIKFDQSNGNSKRSWDATEGTIALQDLVAKACKALDIISCTKVRALYKALDLDLARSLDDQMVPLAATVLIENVDAANKEDASLIKPIVKFKSDGRTFIPKDLKASDVTDKLYHLTVTAFDLPLEGLVLSLEGVRIGSGKRLDMLGIKTGTRIHATLTDEALENASASAGARLSNFSSARLSNFSSADSSLETAESSTPSRTMRDLLKESCDAMAFGPDHCVVDEEAKPLLRMYHAATAFVLSMFISALLIIIIIVQRLVRTLAARLLRTGDKYTRELLEISFRQIAVVAVSLSILYLLQTWDFIEKRLDDHIFRSIYSVIVFKDSNKGQISLVFTTAQGLVQNFLLIYVLYILSFTALAKFNFHWLKKADNLTVEEIVVEHQNTDYLSFVNARYEYIDRVKNRAIRGLDAGSLWFTEYYRACLLVTSGKLIRLPIINLILLQIGVWSVLPLSRVYGMWSVYICLMGMAMPLIILSAVLVWTGRIRYKLEPINPSKFAAINYQQELDGKNEVDDIAVEDELYDIQPRYKFNLPPKVKTKATRLARMVYGTNFLNKHEALFVFGRNGPGILTRLTELAFLISMLLLAYILKCINDFPQLWKEPSYAWPIIVVVIFVLLLGAFIPFLLLDLTFISCTGMMIQENIFLDVTLTARSDFVRRTTFFLDGLRAHSMLHQLRAGGLEFWQHLEEAAGNMNDETALERDRMWEMLVSDGLELHPPELLKFLNEQGLNLPDEWATEVWFMTFDRRGKGFLDRTEFDIIVMVLNEMLRDSLDLELVRSLLVEEWGVAPTNGEGVSIRVLDQLLKKLRMEWTEAQKRHLIAFMSNDMNARAISFEAFLEALLRIEKETLSSLGSAVQRMQKLPTVGLEAGDEEQSSSSTKLVQK